MAITVKAIEEVSMEIHEYLDENSTEQDLQLAFAIESAILSFIEYRKNGEANICYPETEE